MFNLEHSQALNLPPGHTVLKKVTRNNRIRAKALAMQRIYSVTDIRKLSKRAPTIIRYSTSSSKRRVNGN